MATGKRSIKPAITSINAIETTHTRGFGALQTDDSDDEEDEKPNDIDIKQTAKSASSKSQSQFFGALGNSNAKSCLEEEGEVT